MSFIEAFKGLVRKRLPQQLLYGLRLLQACRRARALTAQTQMKATVRHKLPQPLLVSLTSFEPRFATLHLTLRSLLNQNVVPDAIVLWIAEDELDLLPPRVRRLEGSGVIIKGCPDIRSYKKLIFALQDYPDSFIATADDDVFYGPAWLGTMVEAINPEERVIVCHRAHRIAVEEDGQIASYLSWPMDVQDEAARQPSVDLLPIGVGGILYPPGCFGAEVLDQDKFWRFSPAADDLWFYWMARNAGSTHKKVGGKFPEILWPTFDLGNLAGHNWAGGNDRQIQNLEREYGNPMKIRISQ